MKNKAAVAHGVEVTMGVAPGVYHCGYCRFYSASTLTDLSHNAVAADYPKRKFTAYSNLQ